MLTCRSVCADVGCASVGGASAPPASNPWPLARPLAIACDTGWSERAVSADLQRSAGSAFEAIVNRLEDLALPTICRLNGGVYGGSTDLALACDFRIGVDSGEMFMPAARLGLHYYKSGIMRYVSRLGVDNAKRLLAFM